MTKHLGIGQYFVFQLDENEMFPKKNKISDAVLCSGLIMRVSGEKSGQSLEPSYNKKTLLQQKK